jgi:hypothetical protein
LPNQDVDAAVERLETAVGEGVEQRVAAENPSWPGDEHPHDSEFAPCERDHLAGLAGERAGVEIEDEAREAHERCGFLRKLDVKPRSFAHRRSSFRTRDQITLRSSLQVLYQPNISTLHRWSMFTRYSVLSECRHHIEEKMMRRATIAGVTIILAVGDPSLKAYVQDPNARCVSVANKQMTIDSAQGRGLYIENFSEAETVAFLKAFNAASPNSNFIATKMFAAVGGDRAYVFFESAKDLCTAPSPLSRERYDAFVEQAQGHGA